MEPSNIAQEELKRDTTTESSDIDPTTEFPRSLTIEKLCLKHNVRNKDELIQSIQKHIATKDKWDWPNNKDPVICDMCKRTVKRDGFSHKHMRVHKTTHKEQYLKFLETTKCRDGIKGQDQHAINMM